ncbi:MAG TPA: hypothetical protein VI504_10665 [Candidatus Eisenbacteria bacterium]
MSVPGIPTWVKRPDHPPLHDSDVEACLGTILGRFDPAALSLEAYRLDAYRGHSTAPPA